MVKWRDMSKAERRTWVSVLVVGPLGFMAVGVALSGAAAGQDGEPLPAVVGVAAALLLAFWLGRRSKADNTAVAVAQAVSAAVSVARATAASEARAQALNQVAVVIGPERAHELLDGAHGASHTQLDHSAGIISIPEAKAPREVPSTPHGAMFDEWPFTGAERVPQPHGGVDGFSAGATLGDRDDAPCDPVEALQSAQVPRTPG